MKQSHFILLLILPLVVSGQGGNIKGYVKSGADSSYVAGATIVLKGTTLGTVTDKNGFFLIGNVKPGNYTLRASFLGFETKEQTILVGKSENKIEFSLIPSDIDLNEVVITGTKSEKTLKNVPVITQVISARKMIELGITNVTDALQNMVIGLNMSQFGTRASITMQGMDSKYVLFLIVLFLLTAKGLLVKLMVTLITLCLILKTSKELK